MLTTAAPSARRPGVAFALSLALNGGLVAALFSLREPAPVPEPVVTMDFDGFVAPSPVSLPPAPKPAGGRTAPRAAHRAAPPDPTVQPPSVEAPPLAELRETTPLPDAALVVGPAGDGEGSQGTGTGEDSGTGIGDGPDDGGGTRGIRVVDWDAVKVRSQVAPVFPASARDLHLGEVACLVRLDIDARGRPLAADVSGCPVAFAQSAQAAAMKWRFAPVPLEAGTEAVRFQITFKFRE